MTNLPELPKKRQHKEADFGLKIREYIESEMPPTAAFELKTTRGKDYFPFSELTDVQVHNGLKIQGKGNLIRIAVGTPGAPDYIWLRQEDYFIVIDYPGFFAFVRLDDFLRQRKNDLTSRLTADRAKAIARFYVIRTGSKWKTLKPFKRYPRIGAC